MGKPRKRKRKGPKSTRAGCLMCKPHKDQANKDSFQALTHADKKKRVAGDEQVRDA